MNENGKRQVLHIDRGLDLGWGRNNREGRIKSVL